MKQGKRDPKIEAEEEKIKAWHARVEWRMTYFDRNSRPRYLDKLPKNQVFSHWQLPGLWVDTQGNDHVDCDWLLFAFELGHTKENIDAVVRYVTRATAADHPGIKVIEQSGL